MYVAYFVQYRTHDAKLFPPKGAQTLDLHLQEVVIGMIAKKSCKSLMVHTFTRYYPYLDYDCKSFKTDLMISDGAC